MAVPNKKLLRKATYGSSVAGLGEGILNAAQSLKFIRMLFDSDPTLQICRTVPMKAKTRELNKISVGSRLVIAPGTNVSAASYIRKPTTNKITLTSKSLKLPWEFTEDDLEDTIEGVAVEDTMAQMMATQFGLDVADLCWNGDSTLEEDSEASGFVEGNELLYVGDGWIIQLDTGSNVFNEAGGGLDKDTFKEAYKAMPKKYKRGANIQKLRWLFSASQYAAYLDYIASRETAAGDLVLIGGGENFKPYGIPIVQIAALPDSVILLADPKNFVVGVHRTIRIEKAARAKADLLDGVHFYVISMRADWGIEWKDAVVKVKNLAV